MKKHLFISAILILSGLNIFAQSIKFSDLVSFTSLGNAAVLNTLLEGSRFKQDYSEIVGGQEMEYFKNTGPRKDTEKINTGSFTKLDDGTILRTVNYSSTEISNVVAMVGQAKNYGLDLQFQGTNETYNIYLYDNNFYMVNIYLRRDQTAGTVEIKQKEYFGLE